jgi:hypothetical protein
VQAVGPGGGAAYEGGGELVARGATRAGGEEAERDVEGERGEGGVAGGGWGWGGERGGEAEPEAGLVADGDADVGGGGHGRSTTPLSTWLRVETPVLARRKKRMGALRFPSLARWFSGILLDSENATLCQVFYAKQQASGAGPMGWLLAARCQYPNILRGPWLLLVRLFGSLAFACLATL